MLSEKTARFWKGGLAAISAALIVCAAGCSGAAGEEAVSGELAEEGAAGEEAALEDLEKICAGLYEKAEKEKRAADLEMIRSIVKRFGEAGYPAVDSKNQIDMENPELAEEFCRKVEAGEEGELTIIEVGDWGGFAQYCLHTEAGIVEVEKSYYQYENGKLEKGAAGSYQAEQWEYTKNGYLMFSGAWFSQEMYVLTLGGVQEQAALRVQPLKEEYRQLGRKYLLPIGFDHNNLFLVDWSEDDFGELDFYDLYALLYPKVHGSEIPYKADENLGVGAVYQIPGEEFEQVIMAYFDIDSETLQSKTDYDPEKETYEYKPRGFYEVEYPEYPYSEVVDVVDNQDGTMTLKADVVFPYRGDAKVYAHEVVIRPLEGGGVQYVSNHVIPSEENHQETWHTPRLAQEEWEEMYQGG